MNLKFLFWCFSNKIQNKIPWKKKNNFHPPCSQLNHQNSRQVILLVMFVLCLFFSHYYSTLFFSLLFQFQNARSKVTGCTVMLPLGSMCSWLNFRLYPTLVSHSNQCSCVPYLSVHRQNGHRTPYGTLSKQTKKLTFVQQLDITIITYKVKVDWIVEDWWRYAPTEANNGVKSGYL